MPNASAMHVVHTKPPTPNLSEILKIRRHAHSKMDHQESSSQINAAEPSPLDADLEPARGPKRFYQPTKLCLKCQPLIDVISGDLNLDSAADYVHPDRRDHRHYFRHHTSPSALSLSAQDGCGLCSQLVRSGPRYIRGRVSFPDFFAIDSLTGWAQVPKKGNHRLVVAFFCDMSQVSGEPNSDRKFSTAIFYTNLFEALCQAEDLSFPGRQSNTGDALPLCERWLRECRYSHRQCDPDPSFHGFIPTRLIDVGSRRPRICLAEDLPVGDSQVQYATLSHCWGNLKFTTLATANLEVFRQGLPLHELSKTFLDAIHIARYLGFQYLWIDSLCILQDSTDDWIKESGMMTQVYGMSSLNIAATAAENGSVGCFFDRAQDWRCQVRNSNQTILWNIHPPGFLASDRASNMLAKRGWVLQERYLPCRTIHFDDNQIFWECNEYSACEVHPSGLPDDRSRNMGFYLSKGPLTTALWGQIVKAYSKAELTNTSDKLVAIGGLARLIQDNTGDEYIAGMWRKDFEHQLLWHSTRDLNGHHRINTGTPTWSWASVQGAISYPDYQRVDGNRSDVQLCVCAHDIRITHSSVNQFGGILDANLRLRCEYFYNGILTPTPRSEYRLRFGSRWSNILQVYLDLSEVYAGKKESRPVYILVVKSVAHGQASRPFDYLSISGLLLEPTGLKRGQYRRVGYWHHDGGRLSTLQKVAADHDLVSRRSVDDFADMSTEGENERFFIDLV